MSKYDEVCFLYNKTEFGDFKIKQITKSTVISFQRRKLQKISNYVMSKNSMLIIRKYGLML